VQNRAHEKLQLLQSDAWLGAVPNRPFCRSGEMVSFVLRDAKMRRIQRHRMAGYGVFVGPILLHDRILRHYRLAGIPTLAAGGTRSDSIGTGQTIFAETG
jgi:hypothetical protein